MDQMNQTNIEEMLKRILIWLDNLQKQIEQLKTD